MREEPLSDFVGTVHWSAPDKGPAFRFGRLLFKISLKHECYSNNCIQRMEAVVYIKPCALFSGLGEVCVCDRATA